MELDLELTKRCAELGGVLRAATECAIEVYPAPVLGFEDRWIVAFARGERVVDFGYSAAELCRGVHDIAVELVRWAMQESTWTQYSRLRSPAGEDGEDEQDRQHDDDDGVGALSGHIHDDVLRVWDLPTFRPSV
jgi:hypothetical protein